MRLWGLTEAGMWRAVLTVRTQKGSAWSKGRPGLEASVHASSTALTATRAIMVQEFIDSARGEGGWAADEARCGRARWTCTNDDVHDSCDARCLRVCHPPPSPAVVQPSLPTCMPGKQPLQVLLIGAACGRGWVVQVSRWAGRRAAGAHCCIVAANALTQVCACWRGLRPHAGRSPMQVAACKFQAQLLT